MVRSGTKVYIWRSHIYLETFKKIVLWDLKKIENNYKLLSKIFDFRHRNLIQFCQTDQLAAHCRSIHELFVIK